MKKVIALSLTLISFFCEGQSIPLIDDPGDSLVTLDEGWTYKMSDRPGSDGMGSKNWKSLRPAADIHDSIPDEAKTGVGLMQLLFRVSERARDEHLTLMIRQSIASEIYLNGKSIRKYGVVSDNPSAIKAYDPRWEPVPLDISTDSVNLLEVRFAVQPGVRYITYYGAVNPFFSVVIGRTDEAIEKYKEIYIRPWMDVLLQGIILMVFVLHISFFLMYHAQRANLLFAIAALCTFIVGWIVNYYYYYASPDQKFLCAVLASVFYAVNQIFLFTSIHSYLKIHTKSSLWIIALIQFLGIIVGIVWYKRGFELVLANVPLITYLLIIIISISQRKRVRESIILTIGLSISFISFFLFLATVMTFYDNLLRPVFDPPSFFFLIFMLGPPTSVSIFLAYDFARTSKRLKEKLDEVEILSEKNVAVEKEKQEILTLQNQRLETKVQERTAALNQSINELKSTQSQLIQSAKMASLGELTAGIAHEIQNPLNFVNNFSELNRELLHELKEKMSDRNPDDATKIINDVVINEEKINHHGKRADAIVKAMLQHSRSTTGVKELTDLNALADEYLRLAFHGFRAKDKSFNATAKTDLDQRVGKVLVVQQDIGRVILNLITNAFYAVSEKKKLLANEYEPIVELKTKKQDGHVLISVIDNGNGISSKILDKIFQPFFTTKPTGQGTGLGLSLSYDIVKAHGGEIKVESKEGEGAVFTIVLGHREQ